MLQVQERNGKKTQGMKELGLLNYLIVVVLVQVDHYLVVTNKLVN